MVRCLRCGWKMKRHTNSDGAYLLCRNQQCKRLYLVREFNPQRELKGEVLSFLVNGKVIEVVKGFLPKDQSPVVSQHFLSAGNTSTPSEITKTLRQVSNNQEVPINGF